MWQGVDLYGVSSLVCSLAVLVCVVTVCGLIVAVWYDERTPRTRKPRRRPHVASGSFCDVCGSHTARGEKCDAGLHS